MDWIWSSKTAWRHLTVIPKFVGSKTLSYIHGVKLST